MNIKEQAKQFAIKAHSGQIRKSDPIKPKIVHPIDAAQVVEKYGYDDNVVAAAYLHDVIEDTKYTKEDIKELFGEDICSLVVGASESDKSLSWEERKKETIKKIKNLDRRHKAVICADKISNLGDIRILIETDETFNFDKFKRGYDKQKWYYEGVYESLIENDIEEPIYLELKEIIDFVFKDKKNNDFIKNKIFMNQEILYKNLMKLHYKKEELKKLHRILNIKTPYIIEFMGTPRTGKTSLINNLEDFFKKSGFSVKIIEEFTTSKKYKEKIKPSLKDDYNKIVFDIIPSNILNNINNAIKENYDIIIIDRALVDRLVWANRTYQKNKNLEKEYKEYKDKYIKLTKKKENIIIETYADSITCLKRDYYNHLSLEKRTFLNKENIDEYNNSLLNIEQICKENNINLYKFDTTNNSEKDIEIEIVNKILDDMKLNYLNKKNYNIF